MVSFSQFCFFPSYTLYSYSKFGLVISGTLLKDFYSWKLHRTSSVLLKTFNILFLFCFLSDLVFISDFLVVFIQNFHLQKFESFFFFNYAASRCFAFLIPKLLYLKFGLADSMLILWLLLIALIFPPVHLQVSSLIFKANLYFSAFLLFD